MSNHYWNKRSLLNLFNQAHSGCWNMKEVSHASFDFTSSTVGIWSKSRTKASLSHLQLLEFEGSLERKMHFWEIADARHAVFCRAKRVSDDVWGSLSGGRLRNTLVSTATMLGSAPQWNWQFRHHFGNFKCWNLKEVLHASFDFTSSTVLEFWRKSRTKASFSHLQLLDLKQVSHESFDFTSSTVGIWSKPRTQASISHLQLLEFEGSSSYHQLLEFEGGPVRNAFLRDSGCTTCCLL